MSAHSSDRVLTKIAAQAETLAQLAHQLGDAETPDALIHTAARLLGRVTSFHQLLLLLRDADGHLTCYNLHVLRAHPDIQANLLVERLQPERAPDDLLVWLLNLRQALLTTHRDELIAIPARDTFRFIAPEAHSLVSTTFELPGRQRAVLALLSRETQHFDAVDRATLRFFGTTLAGYLAPRLLATPAHAQSSGAILARSTPDDPNLALSRGVARSFNNILCGLKVWTQLVQEAAQQPLLQPDLDPDTRRTLAEGLDAITHGVDRGLTIVDQLTDLTGERRRTTRSNLFDGFALLDSTLDLLRERIPHADNVRLTTRANPDASPLLLGDSGALRAALYNILANALEATAREGHVLVHAETRVRDLLIRVTDTGPGIPDHLHDQLLLPFVSTKGEHHTGLGLPVAHAILQRAGGHLRILPQQPRGVTVEITLPLARKADLAPPQTAPHPRGVQPLRVLIVDHDARDLQRLARLLRELGHHPLLASSGREALPYADRPDPPHLAIIAQDLPDMAGASLVKVLRAASPNTTFALLIDPNTSSPGAFARRTLVDHTLQRPLEPLDLRALLDQIPSRAS